MVVAGCDRTRSIFSFALIINNSVSFMAATKTIMVLIVTKLGRLRLATVDGAPPAEFQSPTNRVFKRLPWGRMDVDTLDDVVEMYTEKETNVWK